MKNNNIFIISDNRKTAEDTASKILLSRKNDSVCISDFKLAYEILQKHIPEIIIIHVEKKNHCELIDKIKQNSRFKETSVIILSSNSDRNLLCESFDKGIDDFIDANFDETTLNIRIILALKNRIIKVKSLQKSEVLSLSGITDKNTQFYTNEYTKKVFEREYKKSISNYKNTVFMMISADKQCQETLSIYDIGQILQNMIRKNDLCGYIKNEKIYLLLHETDSNGAKKIFEKINNNLPFDYSVSAAALNAKAYEKFSEAEKTLNRIITKSLENGNSYIFSKNNSEINPVFNKLNPEFGNTLKKELRNKIEKTVTPSFFKMQSIYEPKFFDTEIKQNFSETESTFIIKNRNGICSITVKYNDFSEIEIITKEIFKQKTVCDTVKISIDNFSGEKLENIIQKSTEKFREKIYKSEK